MAETIGNLGDVLADAVEQGSFLPTVFEGVSVVAGSAPFIATSDSNNIDITGLEDFGDLRLVLTGNADLDITGSNNDNRIVGNDGDNVLSGNDGDDQYSTGGGKDTINFGKGSNTVEVDGGGEKTIVGNLDGGNNLIIIKPAVTSADASTTLLTKLKVGDRVRVEGIKDTNGDGKLTVDDIEGISSDSAGNAVFTLKDGSSFTLSGVSAESALNGDIAYEITDNGNGFDVVLKAAADMG